MDALRKLGSLGRRRDKVDATGSPLINEDSAADISRNTVEISGKDEASPSGLTPIRVRVPEEARAEGEVQRDGDEGSVGSGDSFDSALERMEASSITSFEPPSPMESVDGRFQFEDGVREDLAESGLEGNFSYDDDDDEDDDEEEEDGSEEGESTSSSIINSEYSSSASNTEDEIEITGYGASSARTMLVSNGASESDEEAIDESKYKVKKVVTGEENMLGGLSVESEARGVAPSSWKTEFEDFYEASPEDNDDQEELAEKIIKVAREHDDEEDEEVRSSDIASELPRGNKRNRTMIESPDHLYSAVKAVDPTLPVLKSERAKSNTQSFVMAEESESDVDTEGDDGYGDEDEDGDTEILDVSQATGKSGTPSESESNPSMGAAGPRLPSLPQRSSARRPATTTATGVPRPNTTSSTQLAVPSDASINIEARETNEIREKLHNIRIKFLRLARRLTQSPQNVVVAQVLYRLGLAESLRGGGSLNSTEVFSYDHANALAEEQEAANYEDLDFTCTILALGKTGVGKSATINSIFDERKSVTSAYHPSTTKVHEVSGTVLGVKIRFIDTPGLLPSTDDHRHNERIMRQVKKYIKNVSPDIVLYFDRMDVQTRDFGDVPLLRTITDVFGTAVWFNATVVLTHASTAPPDGSNGAPMSYDYFVAQRSHFVQQTIRQAAGDTRLQNPVSLVENHPACRTNRSGQRVLPNGQTWKQQLLLLCFASKILAEANMLLKLQEASTPGKPFGQRSQVPPLPFLLSSLLQSRAQLRMPNDQQEESDDSDDDSDEDDEEADEYDDLPPFRPLSKQELEELSKEQRQEYAEELADRERLFQKKQYREQVRRRREIRKRASAMNNDEPSISSDGAEDESGQPATVAVPMPDMALPPSFDSDNPTHRYRYLETANQWLVRPVLETHGWDHDAGYDGFNVEKMFVVKDKIPASVSGQVTKDKKEAQVNFEAAASLRHGEGKVTLTGFDVQTIGKDLAYTLRAETRFNNFKRNKTTAGVTATYLNDTIAAGVKLEDRVLIGKRVKLVVNGGVLTGKGDKAYGGSLEATLRGKEYPLSRTLSTLGLSVMDWHGDLAIGGNLQSQFMVGKTMMVGRANLNNRGSGQVSIRASSSEQLQMVLIGIVPILRSLINCRFGFGGQSQQ